MSPVEGPVGTHGFLGLFCGLCQADIDCNLTIGHDTEQPDSKHKMILIPSSSARLGHTQQEGHNAVSEIYTMVAASPALFEDLRSLAFAADRGIAHLCSERFLSSPKPRPRVVRT